jgi:xylan 1,4-beta-xylosidase
MASFARHLIARYGIDEVAQWYFEVWNEPNAGFWGGKPYQPTYFELYEHTARALKGVSARLRVGGPATAQAAWAGEFIRHCQAHGIPLDFVSSHAYANDDSQDIFQNDMPVPRDEMVCRAVRKVHDEIKASPLPQLPLIWSEYNASYANEPNVTDSVYMGPWLAATVSRCDGLTQAMAYWTFSDVFEENGVVRRPFYGGYGLVAEHDIPKPAYNAFALLHRLGERRLPLHSDAALATRRRDGALVIALWNYAPPGPAGAAQLFQLELRGLSRGASARLYRLDRDHGNVLKDFEAMGRPDYPNTMQIAALRQAAILPPPEAVPIVAGRITVEIPSQGLVLIEVR